MKIKKGDTVIMRLGKDRGKNGKVLSVDRLASRVVVEGLNMFKKTRKPRNAQEKGQVVSFSKSVPMSSVSLVCPQCGKGTRVGAFVPTEGKKLRRCQRCQATFA